MAPPKKKSKVIYIVLGCLGLSLVACLGTGGYAWWVANNAVEELQDDLEEFEGGLQDTLDEAADNAAGGGTAAGGSVCSRALECCAAYGTAMPGMTADQACAGARAPGITDPSCQLIINGYRTGLEAMGTAVPASCQ